MSTVDLKLNIHKLIETIQNEQLLITIYDFLKVKQSEKPGKLWDSLSEDDKREILMVFDESEDESNLVEASRVFKMK